MTRVLYLGDMAGTGFGTVTRDLGGALLDIGEDVRFLSLNELPGTLEEPFASRTMLLGHPDGYMGEGQADKVISAFTGWEDGWTPEVIVVLGDFAAVRILPHIHADIAAVIDRTPTFHYVPVEGVGLPPSWGSLWRILRPVAMSRFGAEQIARVTGSMPPVIYHGINTQDFYPVSAKRPIRGGDIVLRSRKECREALGIDPDRTWLFRADRHMPRKNYNAMLRAMAPVLRRNPKLGLLIHCRTDDEGGNLNDAKSKMPREVWDQVQFSGFHDSYGGAPRWVLAAMYNAADLYLSTAAEGFGLTIAESLACGVPAVGLDYSAVPEVIGPAGRTVPCFPIDNPYDHFWATPDERAFGNAVEALVADIAALRVLGSKGPEHIRSSFRWDNAARQFSDLFASVLAVAA
jgi:glycosyltransferase involved in cell wall biosynthesis